MLRGEPPRATLEDGLRSAITAFAVDEAMAQGRLIDVMPYWRQAGISEGAAPEQSSQPTKA
ncbi:MAG TPA: gfo/Idh/MocA family oxidoreductase, partial [Phycisphaerae bacterium]|nr:gfo/Idh/MocA family oxidoreductase [Phycisphaerae bacterium]